MKILMTSETCFPSVGGAEVHLHNLYTRMQILGHHVVLITNDLHPDSEEINIIRIPWSGRSMVKILLRIWKESEGSSLIHSHYAHRLAMLSGIVGRLKGIPVVVTLHGMGILDLPNSGIVARIKHSIYRYAALKLCTHVISTSEDLALVADRYIRRDKLTVIMNGYDAKKFYELESSEVLNKANLSGKRIIMTVRRLVAKNGPHYLIESLPFILSQVPNVHYVVVGDGRLRKSMEDRVQELGLIDKVTFVGMVDNTQVAQYLSIADVVVFPSTAESSSIACAEAMGMRKMIVASRVGGLVELLGAEEERGYLVDLVPWSSSNYGAPKTLPEVSYHNLADGIVAALQSDKKNEEIRTRASNYAKGELSWESILDKTISVYDRVRI